MGLAHVDGVEALYGEYSQGGATILRPRENVPWRAR
jgi:hypothetical protein